MTHDRVQYGLQNSLQVTRADNVRVAAHNLARHAVLTEQSRLLRSFLDLGN